MTTPRATLPPKGWYYSPEYTDGRRCEQPAGEVAELVKRLNERASQGRMDQEEWDKDLLEAAVALESLYAQAAELKGRAEAAEKALADSEAKLVAAEKDAERYRYLKKNKAVNVNIMTDDRVSRQIPGETLDVLLDAAIDAASKGGKP